MLCKVCSSALACTPWPRALAGLGNALEMCHHWRDLAGLAATCATGLAGCQSQPNRKNLHGYVQRDGCILTGITACCTCRYVGYAFRCRLLQGLCCECLFQARCGAAQYQSSRYIMLEPAVWHLLRCSSNAARGTRSKDIYAPWRAQLTNKHRQKLPPDQG